MCSSLLSCPLCCLSSFPDLETFKLNLIKVNSKPIKCPFPKCDEILLGLDKLTIHLFGHSLPAEEPEVIKSEAKAKSVAQIVRATRQPRNAKMAKSTSSSSLQSHQQKSTATVTSDESSFRCELCGFVFYDENLLNLHLSLVHNFLPSNRQHADESGGIDRLASKDNSETNSSQTTDGCGSDEIKEFHCHLCSKHFKLKGALRIHIRVAHVKFQDQNKRQINIANYLKTQKSLMKATSESQLDQCMMKTENLTLQDPLSPASSVANSPASFQQVPSPQQADKPPKLHTCDDCKKTFTSKYFLKKHKRLHTGEMPYTCEQCGKSFFFQQSYHKHLNYHNDEKPYECSECGRNFKELSTLHNHERIHSGLKPFGCEICGKFFRQKVSYLVHTRIHTGVLPYKCSECGKGFRYKVSQRSHKCTGTVEQQQQPASPGDVIQKLMQDASISNVANATVVAHPTSTNVVQATRNPYYDNLHNNNVVIIPVEATNSSVDQEFCLDDLIKDDSDSYEKYLKHNNAAMSNVIEHQQQQQFIPLMLNSIENNFNTSSSDNNEFVFDFHNGSANGDDSAFNNVNMGTMSAEFEPLLSNFNSDFHHSVLETINEDSIKELLGALR